MTDGTTPAGEPTAFDYARTAADGDPWAAVQMAHNAAEAALGDALPDDIRDAWLYVVGAAHTPTVEVTLDYIDRAEAATRK